jgi:RNA polymerase sigma-70 factor (ECF subfamily)
MQRAVERPHAYLWRVVDNVLIDHARGDARFVHLPDDESDPAWPEGLEPALAPATELIADLRQRLRLMETVLHSLPPRCREVFWLLRVEGNTQPAIAAQLGLSLKTVEGHVARALTQLAALRDAGLTR